MWERTAEITHWTICRKSFARAPGRRGQILQTVVNNLIVTNNLEIIPDVRCRVLLSSPLESFTVATLVVSRGCSTCFRRGFPWR